MEDGDGFTEYGYQSKLRLQDKGVHKLVIRDR
jgi:hypothetical protein